jgi:CheY-like chemotaxis protein
VPGKVLIADDSGKIQKELAQLLQDAGVEVATVSNGEHAVRQLSSFKPDVVLADIFMPVRSGYEVCDYIKNSPDFAETAVLLLVSKLEPFDEKEAERVGADGKIDKPFESTEAVLTAIKQHLDKLGNQEPAPLSPEAAVPVAEEAPETAPEPEPEPEPDLYSTRPPPVQFDEQAAPMGFTEMVEEEVPAEASAEAAPVTEEERIELPEAPVEEAAQKGPASTPEVVAEEEPAPAQEVRAVEKPELAAAWEMTGPEPGAPEIPPAGGWESQWAADEAAAEATPVTEEETAPAPTEQAMPAAEEQRPEPEPEAAPAVEEPPAVVEEPALAVAEEVPRPEAAELTAAAEAPAMKEEVWGEPAAEEETRLAGAYGAEDFAAAFAGTESPAEEDRDESAAIVQEEAPASAQSVTEETIPAMEPPAPEAVPVAEPPVEEAVAAETPTKETPSEAVAPTGAPVDVPAGETPAEVAAPPSTAEIDPTVIDEVVNQVLERLSPQVMETIAGKIVRPLAEALLREKLKD